ncbi:hypothetical protein ACQZ6F_31225 [Rhizobium sp. A22-96]
MVDEVPHPADSPISRLLAALLCEHMRRLTAAARVGGINSMLGVTASDIPLSEDVLMTTFLRQGIKALGVSWIAGAEYNQSAVIS